MTEEEKKEKFDLYALKRKINKEKRVLRNQIIGTDTVDGSSMMRNYTEATKTRRALKVEMFGSKSKASATNLEETSIEKIISEFLEQHNIKHTPQKAIRYINVDEFLPEYNTVIQIHGCYWHCCEKCYPLGPKNNIQRKNLEKDKVANEIIQQGKYNLIELWEHSFKEDTEKLLKDLFVDLEKIKNDK